MKGSLPAPDDEDEDENDEEQALVHVLPLSLSSMPFMRLYELFKLSSVSVQKWSYLIFLLTRPNMGLQSLLNSLPRVFQVDERAVIESLVDEVFNM